jgi:hypothetical protein
MKDVDKLTNAELDVLALEQDASQGQKVLDRVYEFLGRFISYPSDDARIAHTAWIIHAHLMDRWDSTPRLAFLSAEPASGKSRALEVTELLVPRPIQTVNVSPNYLFRKVADKDGLPTVLFDEIDTIFGPKAKENEEIRGWLNAGHRRGATAGRCVVRGKIVETEELPAYSAVAVAGAGCRIRSSRAPSSFECVAVTLMKRSSHSVTGIILKRRYRSRWQSRPGRSRFPKSNHGLNCPPRSRTVTPTSGKPLLRSATWLGATGRNGFAGQLLRSLRPRGRPSLVWVSSC